MSTRLLLVTEVPVQQAESDRAVKGWREHNAQYPSARVLYRSLEDSALLELRPLAGLEELATLQQESHALWDTIATTLAGDFRRHVHEFVEAPKDCDTDLPDTRYVQLRRVEVKPPRHSEYRAWRERTIFETVRGADESEIFLAYHSLLSAAPGVLFVSGFSGDPALHNGVFQTPAYEAILEEVRESYIIPQGGEGGLHTKTYERIGA